MHLWVEAPEDVLLLYFGGCDVLFNIFREEPRGCYGAGGAGSGDFFVGDEAFFDGEFGGARVVWIVYVVLVEDGVDHDCLLMNR